MTGVVCVLKYGDGQIINDKQNKSSQKELMKGITLDIAIFGCSDLLSWHGFNCRGIGHYAGLLTRQ